MANIWVIESSQVIRRMVTIALDGLPAHLSFGGRSTELINSTEGSPHLILCAEQVTSPENSIEQSSYLLQLQEIATAGHQCPVIILQNQ